MKKSFYFFACCLIFASISFISCSDKDEFTIENKVVTGDFTYVRTAFIPLTFDSTGFVPTSAQISMDGTGSIEEFGDLHLVSTFTFNFITGVGSGFDITFTGDNPADVFHTGGTSQLQPNGTFIIADELISGTGKFAKISGDGTTVVALNQALDAGTGVVSWTVTF